MRNLLGVSIAVLCSASAMAGTIVWDNGNNDGSGQALSSQRDTAFPFDSQTADDFMLPRNTVGDPLLPTAISEVHWQGVWFNPGPPGNATAFNILFYADAGGVPTGGPTDPSGTALASYTIPAGGVNETALAGGYFQYSAVLPSAFVAQKEVRYWVAIQSVNNFPPQWGWAFSTGTFGNTATQGFPFLNVPYWTAVPAQMAFQLVGDKIPEPTSLALLSLGALALLRRR